VFIMRPAEPGDRAAVREMTAARSTWLEERGLPGWRESTAELGRRCDNRLGTEWLMEHDGLVVGRTTVHHVGPPWAWTPGELAEPALYVSGTLTHPAHRAVRPGGLIARWAVDRAARLGLGWVRRECVWPDLVAYYRTQGFAVVRELAGPPRRVFALARSARRLDLPAALLREEAGPAGNRRAAWPRPAPGEPDYQDCLAGRGFTR
jgi:GNAT superfamily N-acetyltransferase